MMNRVDLFKDLIFVLLKVLSVFKNQKLKLSDDSAAFLRREFVSLGAGATVLAVARY